MKNLFVAALILLVFKSASAQQYIINAHITGFKDQTKFILKDNDVDANIDSAFIIQDHFVLKGTLESAPKALWLYTTVGQTFYYTNLLIGNEKVDITGDIKDFPFDLKITGSKSQDGLNSLFSLVKSYYKKRNELVAQYFKLSGDSAKIKGKEIWKIIGKLDSSDHAIKKTFIKNNLNSYAGLEEVFFVKESYSKDSLTAMYNALTPEYRKSSFGQRIGNYIKVGETLKLGDNSFDFSAIDKTGASHKLSDAKGKYVLLDFSATYCGPCMQSIAELKKLAESHADDLNVITFSGDGGKATWLTGVKRDNIPWLSLWDGKGSYGETIMKYGVNGFPTFFLIDPQGKIVNKWVGYETGALQPNVDKAIAMKKAVN
jgi:peroxiredoxin